MVVPASPAPMNSYRTLNSGHSRFACCYFQDRNLGALTSTLRIVPATMFCLLIGKKEQMRVGEALYYSGFFQACESIGNKLMILPFWKVCYMIRSKSVEAPCVKPVNSTIGTKVEINYFASLKVFNRTTHSMESYRPMFPWNLLTRAYQALSMCSQ